MQTNDVNVIIFWVCVAIGAVVYAAIIWSLVAYRKSRNREASFHKHTATEIAWTVIPLIIIIAMTIPAANLLTDIVSGNTPDSENGFIELAEQERQQLVFTVKVSHSVRITES